MNNISQHLTGQVNHAYNEQLIIKDKMLSPLFSLYNYKTYSNLIDNSYITLNKI